MKCPFCSNTDNKVLESRLNQSGDITRRRRECLHCGGRYTTYERLETVFPMVIKKDDRREPFLRQKIFSGIQKACEKRPIDTQQIESIVRDIELKIAAAGSREIPSRVIGHMVMAALHELDKVAYIRFASVYREFKDVEEFIKDITEWPQSPHTNDDLTFNFVAEGDEA